MQQQSLKLALLVVGLGGFLGTIARFWVGIGIQQWLGQNWPYDILFVNVTGAFFLAIWMVLSQRRYFVAVGFIGSYTTFSSLVLGDLLLWQNDSWWSAALYAGSNVFLGIIAVILGQKVGLFWMRYRQSKNVALTSVYVLDHSGSEKSYGDD